MTATAKIKLSPYHGFICPGSEISNPDVDSGYQPALVREIARVGTKGGTITADAEGLRDLAEFAEALANAESQGENHSGARSLGRLAERCLAEARRLEAS
jgi:hypothetical protein